MLWYAVIEAPMQNKDIGETAEHVGITNEAVRVSTDGLGAATTHSGVVTEDLNAKRAASM